VIDLIKADLVADEGFVSHAYRDSLGYLTIGIGRLVDEEKGGGITYEEAVFLLENDIFRCVRELKKNLPWFDEAPEPVRRALVNMAFQMGVNGLLSFKNTLALIEEGKYKEAAQNALKSKWATQTPARAKRVTALIAKAT